MKNNLKVLFLTNKEVLESKDFTLQFQSFLNNVSREINKTQSLQTEISFHSFEEIRETSNYETEDFQEIYNKLLFQCIPCEYKQHKIQYNACNPLRADLQNITFWLENKTLREKASKALDNYLNKEKFDLVITEGVFSLIAYDYLRSIFSSDNEAFKKKDFENIQLITLENPIGHSEIKQHFGGRIEKLPVSRWVNLLSTAPCSLSSSLNLPQAFNFFEQTINGKHSEYLQTADLNSFELLQALFSSKTLNYVWTEILTTLQSIQGITKSNKSQNKDSKESNFGFVIKKIATQKALLVGIDNYPHLSERLNGCVNDVYLMSSLLQELGFENGREIRVILNERATTSNILKNL
ncbi:MAG TPA: caspase family protein, partial [Vampirovibrionales bacterium]